MSLRRFDCGGGWFVRVNRWWFGLVSAWPFAVRVPVIAGGSDAISAQGTYISRANDGSPDSGTFTELAEVTSITLNETSEEIDVTHLRSTGGYREYIQSFKDAGEVGLELNFILGGATQQQLRSDYENSTKTGWKITFPDGSTCVFEAFVKMVGVPVAVGDKLKLDASLRVSGATEWTFA